MDYDLFFVSVIVCWFFLAVWLVVLVVLVVAGLGILYISSEMEDNSGSIGGSCWLTTLTGATGTAPRHL